MYMRWVKLCWYSLFSLFSQWREAECVWITAVSVWSVNEVRADQGWVSVGYWVALSNGFVYSTCSQRRGLHTVHWMEAVLEWLNMDQDWALWATTCFTFNSEDLFLTCVWTCHIWACVCMLLYMFRSSLLLLFTSCHSYQSVILITGFKEWALRLWDKTRGCCFTFFL